jgi:hypothetical protein
MAFDFPASPTNGQEFTPSGGPTYVYNGQAWIVKSIFAQPHTYTAPQTAGPVAIASGVAADFSAAQAFTCAVSAAFTIANPSGNPAIGTYVTITITWTAAGVVTFGSNFKGFANYTQSTWTSGTMRDHIVFRWSGATYDLVGAAKGINL